MGAGLLLEGTALWILPDIPSIRHRLDAESKSKRTAVQRRYYLRELFEASPMGQKRGFLSLFLESEPTWYIDPRFANYTQEAHQYNGMIEALYELRAFQKIHPERVSGDQIKQIDESINVWLGLVHAAQRIQESLKGMDRNKLRKEAETLAGMKEESGGDRTSQLVFQQRLLNLNQKLEKLPDLERNRALALARAERLTGQIESFRNTVLTAVGDTDTSELDLMVDTYQFLEGDTVAVQTEVQLLTEGGDPELLLDRVLERLDLQRQGEAQ